MTRLPSDRLKHLWFERGAYANKKARQYLRNEFDPASVKKITVIRHAALGDQVILRPFLVEARKFFPNVEITLAAVSNYQYGMPTDLVDHVNIMPGSDMRKTTGTKDKIASIKALGEQDIIFDLASTNRSHWMMTLGKAKLKIGFPYGSLLRKLLCDVAVFRSDLQPEVEVMLDMLRILGHTPPTRLDFAYPDQRDMCEKEKPFILYFNGASMKDKILSKQQMREVVEKSMAALPDYQHIYLEGKNDFEKGEFLQDLTGQGNFAIQDCLPLDELVLKVAQASLLVAPDTGVRNIAISTHTPTVGIFYFTVPYRYTPLYEPHYIVMRSDASVPSSDEIVAATVQALQS
ncbi:Glycosyltransferase family 9 (heptosyltransferase) [Marinomonas aquimarina]|uniref:Glycosyltransferase family 9 (Heptosyltransferase) n=1 Tax=Marinomonas aquimarina TaxID=295068 RepID=A0A1A8TQ75_9GAMM|nr:glycosyltransferase family 9 protein [Marinomonas aquimarina]SBS34949.1 Glycosyltransferase family 9 (heptosyltransferase) [Marinomonas aquimarina]